MTAKVSSVQGSCLYQSNATYLNIYIYISSSMNICPKRYATYLFNYWNFMNKLKATRDPREWGHENHIRGTDALQYSQSWYRKGWPGPGVSKDCRTWMEMDHQWFSTELLTWMWFRMKNLMSFHIDCVCVIKKEFKVEDTIYSYRLITTTWKKYLWSKVPLSVYDHWSWSNPSASVGWNVNQTFAQCSPRKDDRKLQHQRAQTMLSSNMQQLQSLKLVFFFGVVCLKYRPKGGER